MEQIMNGLEEYLVVIVILGCMGVGFIIKHLLPSDKLKRFIPLIMAALGIFLNAWINKWSFTPQIFLGGLLSGLASTGLHQMFKQFIETKTGSFLKDLITHSTKKD